MFEGLGFEVGNKDKTSGSRMEFINKDLNIKYFAHKPHPDSIVKAYVLRQVKEFLTKNGII